MSNSTWSAEALETVRKNQEAGKNGQSQEVRVSHNEVSPAADANKDEPEKRPEPKDKTKPISSTPVSGTPWYEICNSHRHVL